MQDMEPLTGDEIKLVRVNRKIAAMLEYMRRTGSNEASAYAWIQSEAERVGPGRGKRAST